ncbi:MAG: Cd(II)/Pb(II)-responsive transcriptional regulator [Acidithiobacillus sp.]
MRIGALGQATGVDPETIRYYERIGLLPAPARRANGYRAYGPAHLERLAFVRHCRALDMPLADVQRLLHLLNHPLDDCRDVNRLIDTHLTRVQERLQSLQALARQLEQLRGRCHEQHATAECGILHELVAAAQGEGCVCHGNSVQTTQKGRRLGEDRPESGSEPEQ